MKSGWCIDELQYRELGHPTYAAHLHKCCPILACDCPGHANKKRAPMPKPKGDIVAKAQELLHTDPLEAFKHNTALRTSSICRHLQGCDTIELEQDGTIRCEHDYRWGGPE